VFKPSAGGPAPLCPEPSTGVPQARTIKAEALLRESSPKQAQIHKQGLDQQRSDITDYAGRVGIEIVRWETIVESASKWERPLWERVVQGVIERHLRRENDAVLFDRPDRETRNLLASAPSLSKLLKAGVRVFFASEEFELDPRNPKALDQYFDKADDARSYANSVSRGWRRVHHTRAKKGKHPTNQRLFGFIYQNDQRVLDEAMLPFAREAITRVRRDKQLSPVVRWLWSKGVTALNSASALRRWLQNPALKGETSACGEIIQHEGLISSIEWDEVQAILKENSPRPSRKGYLPIPFVCGCGTRMKADKHQRKHLPPRVYVHCPRCHKPYYRLDRLLPMISLATLAYIGDKREFLRDSVVKGELRERVLTDLEDVSKAKNRLKAQWKALFDRKADWRGPKEILDEKEESLLSQESHLKEKENRLLGELNELPKVEVIDIEDAWDQALAPYTVHFTSISLTPPTVDDRTPEGQALKLLYQDPPSSFYKINNLKPLYLNPTTWPKPGEGCIVPEPLACPDIPHGWGSGGWKTPEQFKSAFLSLDGWVWNLLRDLKAEAFLDQGHFRLRFYLQVNPRRPNKTHRCISPCRHPGLRQFQGECEPCCRRRSNLCPPKERLPWHFPAG
jgi:DNA invertase Pin-like site-specific DNA recombinase